MTSSPKYRKDDFQSKIRKADFQSKIWKADYQPQNRENCLSAHNFGQDSKHRDHDHYDKCDPTALFLLLNNLLIDLRLVIRTIVIVIILQ